jgi:hypothetical protein
MKKSPSMISRAYRHQRGLYAPNHASVQSIKLASEYQVSFDKHGGNSFTTQAASTHFKRRTHHGSIPFLRLHLHIPSCSCGSLPMFPCPPLPPPPPLSSLPPLNEAASPSEHSIVKERVLAQDTALMHRARATRMCCLVRACARTRARAHTHTHTRRTALMHRARASRIRRAMRTSP